MKTMYRAATTAAFVSSMLAGLGAAPAHAFVGPSSACDAGTQVIDTFNEGVHTKLYTLAPSASELDVCVRVESGATGKGGEFVIKAGTPTANVGNLPSPGQDANDAACASTPGNAIPGAHPVSSGGVAGTPYLIDAYLNGTTAWVCLRAGTTVDRLLVPVTVPSVVVDPGTTVTFNPDPGT